jgi:hypothetical protein
MRRPKWISIEKRPVSEEGASNVLNFARLPSPGPGEHAIAQSETGRSVPKLAPAASSPPASVARKRVATAEASKDSISPVDNDSALEFPDGEVVLLTRLCEGQRATVLTLPTQPKSAAEADAQQRIAYFG